MFDFFIEFIYTLTKCIFAAIDSLMSVCNKLCGIEDIHVGSDDVDFMTFLFRSDEVMKGFVVAAVIGFVLIVAFAIIQIIRNTLKEKSDETPVRILVKGGKNILLFMFIPIIMIVCIWALNTLMQVMYAATMNNAPTLGAFMVGSFAQDALKSGVPSDFYTASNFNYLDVDSMWNYFNLWHFDYFYAWVAGLGVLFALGKGILLFVDRAISLVILYIVSPFSIASAMLDDGSRFKLWRDQVLIKFFVGYGSIIGINIYILICGFLSRSDVVFFTSGETYFSAGFLNVVVKVCFILGGAVSLERTMGLVGNLITQGGGTQEMAQAAMAGKSLSGVVGGAIGWTPVGFAGNMVKSAWGEKKRDWAQRMAGVKGGGGGGGGKKGDKEGGENGGENQNSGQPQGNNTQDKNVNNAITGDQTNDNENNNNNNGNQQLEGGDNHNGEQPGNNNNNPVNNMIQNNQQEVDE